MLYDILYLYTYIFREKHTGRRVPLLTTSKIGNRIKFHFPYLILDKYLYNHFQYSDSIITYQPPQNIG